MVIIFSGGAFILTRFFIFYSQAKARLSKSCARFLTRRTLQSIASQFQRNLTTNITEIKTTITPTRRLLSQTTDRNALIVVEFMLMQLQWTDTSRSTAWKRSASAAFSASIDRSVKITSFDIQSEFTTHSYVRKLLTESLLSQVMPFLKMESFVSPKLRPVIQLQFTTLILR